MTDTLQHLFRDAARQVDVPPPPTETILTDGRRRRVRAHRTRAAVAVAASVAVLAAGLAGLRLILDDDRQGRSIDPVGTPTPERATDPSDDPPDSPAVGPLEVSGTGVGAFPFGSDAEAVLADAAARFGDPDLTVGALQYVRIAGSDGWFEDAGDPTSQSWAYPVAAVSCWEVLCLIFGGDDTDALRLRGWEIAEYRRWSGSDQPSDVQSPEVRLAGSGIGLGDTWGRLHAAYPRTVGAGGEGGSLTVQRTPWPAIFDGAGGWRLSGAWDPQRPDRVPDDAVVTRLSGGEGPEPGCC